MADIFTTIGSWLTGLFEGLGASPALAATILMVLGAAVLASAVLFILVFNIWFERKVMARFQDRIGPNRVGPWGIFQTVADLAKLFSKEIIIPGGADMMPFMMAPVIAVMSVILIWAVVPFTPNLIGTDVNIGALYFVAVSSLGVMAILMAGWSSNNKYALLGAFRAVAMLVSYEVPLVLTLMIPVLLTGSMRMNEIVAAQRIAYLFMMPLAGAIFWIASVAEVGRQPFDVLEGESEIVAGYHIEYSGFAFAMFYAAEWAHGFAICALMAVLFLGGWRGPGVEQIPTLGIVYFLLKTFLLYFFQVWTRAILPRIRIDHIMYFCWKFLVPLSLVLVVVTVLVDKTARSLIPGYMLTGSLIEMLPRAAVLLIVNVAVALLAIAWVAWLGRRERERAEAASVSIAPIESGATAQQAR
ncbi:MAG TPA: NADH-quinone oxidoreductase subunit NuoH [Chloroflexi bacterium]|nr:NADH-quinone oxidoreductase subunit NuoH [Chloroflexota bacterium]